MRETLITEENINALDDFNVIVFGDQREWLEPGCTIRNYLLTSGNTGALVIYPDGQGAYADVEESIAAGHDRAEWGQMSQGADGRDVLTTHAGQIITFDGPRVIVGGEALAA